MKRSRRRYTASYSAIQATHSMVVAVIGFSSVALLEAGLSNSQLGLLLTLASIVSAFLQIILSRRADRSRGASLRSYLIHISIALIASALLIFIPRRSATFAGYFSLNMGVPTMIPLISALAMMALNKNFDVNFGVARGLGSLTFAIITAIAGWAIARHGTSLIPWLTILFLITLIAAVSSFRLPRSTAPDAESQGPKDSNSVETIPDMAEADRSSAKHYDRRRFGLVIIGLTLVMGGHSVMSTYMYQIASWLGGDSYNMGIANAVSALMELPPMFGFAWLIRRFRADRLLKLSVVGFALKSILVALVSVMSGLYLVSSLQFLGYGLFIPVSVYYVNQLMPAEDRIQGQAIMNLTWTIGSMGGTFLGGFLLDRIGVRPMLMLAAAIAVSGAVLTIPSTENLPAHKSHIDLLS